MLVPRGSPQPRKSVGSWLVFPHLSHVVLTWADHPVTCCQVPWPYDQSGSREHSNQEVRRGREFQLSRYDRVHSTLDTRLWDSDSAWCHKWQEIPRQPSYLALVRCQILECGRFGVITAAWKEVTFGTCQEMLRIALVKAKIVSELNSQKLEQKVCSWATSIGFGEVLLDRSWVIKRS